MGSVVSIVESRLIARMGEDSIRREIRESWKRMIMENGLENIIGLINSIE